MMTANLDWDDISCIWAVGQSENDEDDNEDGDGNEVDGDDIGRYDVGTR